MKITLTLPELQDRLIEKKFGAKRMESLRSQQATMPALVLSQPIPFAPEGLCALVLMQGLKNIADGKAVLQFAPIVCRCFTVWDARTKELRQVTVEYAGRQFSVDRDCHSLETKHRLVGPGVDPEEVDKSFTALADLLTKHGDDPIVKQCVYEIDRRTTKPVAIA